MLLHLASSLCLSVTSLDSPADTTEGLTTDSGTSEPADTSLMPSSQLVWKSYRDYILDEARNAWNYPSMYLGYEATVSDFFSSILCTADPTARAKTIGWPVNDLLDIKVVIKDYYYDQTTDQLWYKVEAAEGYVLPQKIEENPYILHLEGSILMDGGIDQAPPQFLMEPKKAVLTGDKIILQKQAVAASRYIELDVDQFPELIDVLDILPEGSDLRFDYYNFENITDFLGEEYAEYKYVSAESVLLIPATAGAAYESLMSATDTYEYNVALDKISSSQLIQLPEKLLEKLEDKYEYLESLEKVVYSTTTNVNGINVPVSVMGKLPDNVELVVTPVQSSVVISEGFDIEDESDIITALDIKLINIEDGTEWQPLEGRRVAISIGMEAFGIEDETLFSLHHKHGDHIETFDLVMVENGYITVYTHGFSIYVVDSFQDSTTNTADQINNGAVINLEISADSVYFYTSQTGNGTWEVTDTEGALFYTVYSNSPISSNSIPVRWIRIVALKEATGIKLTYKNVNRTENYTINVIKPKADAGKKELYIIDDVNNSGCLKAGLVDDQGNTVPQGLDGAAFSWERDDGYYIVPNAYGENYESVSVALDHGGLVEARKDGDKFTPTTYTLKARLADGTDLTAKYTVYYQSEIINSSFEFPDAPRSNYSFFPNGWAELYWKTTAPGSTSGNTQNISKDIEYGDLTGGNCATDFGVPQAASGVQLAELNAEAFGALYQDIISVPGEDIEWDFSHAPRRDQNWGYNNAGRKISNAMFIVIGATEYAQKLISQTQLEDLGKAAKQAAKGTAIEADFLAGKAAVEVTFGGAKYSVWYHDAGSYGLNSNAPYGENNNYGWTELSGSYHVPESQYRTRLFFVSEPSTNQYSLNGGNLIDNAKGGQYKSYLIEYYKVSLDGQLKLVTEHLDSDQIGEALIYSSQKIQMLNNYAEIQHYYLHKIMINGENYPYQIRYSEENSLYENAMLYVEKYPFASNFDRDKYAEYDIVMQIYLREVVISVQKNIDFPSEMTDEQKLELIQSIAKEGGYHSYFNVESLDPRYEFSASGATVITQRSPDASYVGYYAVEEHPTIEHEFKVTETDVTDLPGLKLVDVKYSVSIYEDGGLDYTKKNEPNKNYISFALEADRKFAEVFVENVYKEKMTTIYYKAVGNGKVAFAEGGSFQDTPTETLAFYSGKAKGANVYAGNGATFVGWYKDPECTQEVTAVDGVWNQKTNSFKPNANILNADSVTFYAKFESGSITIERTDALKNQVFIYHVVGGGLDMYVTLTCDETGEGIVYILEAPIAEYTITECEDWSWRYPGETITQSMQVGSTDRELHFVFNKSLDDKQWLNGHSPTADNVFQD